MERIPQPKARLIINVMDHGTIVGTDDPMNLEFEDCVNAVDGLIDWLVDSDLREWQAVNDYLADRRRAHQDRIVGDQGPGKFHYDRERLIAEVGSKAQQVVDTYDKSAEAASIAEDAQVAVAASAALEISAVGLGTLIAILATTATADITGVILASLAAKYLGANRLGQILAGVVTVSIPMGIVQASSTMTAKVTTKGLITLEMSFAAFIVAS